MVLHFTVDWIQIESQIASNFFQNTITTKMLSIYLNNVLKEQRRCNVVKKNLSVSKIGSFFLRTYKAIYEFIPRRRFVKEIFWHAFALYSERLQECLGRSIAYVCSGQNTQRVCAKRDVISWSPHVLQTIDTSRFFIASSNKTPSLYAD